MDTGLLILRIVVGLLFVGHGTQKLFGWFRGYGLKGTGGFFEQLGYRPGPAHGRRRRIDRDRRRAAARDGVPDPARGGHDHRNDGQRRCHRAVAERLVERLREGSSLRHRRGRSCVHRSGAYSLDDAFGWTLAGTDWGFAAIGLGALTATLVLASRRKPKASVEAIQQAALKLTPAARQNEGASPGSFVWLACPSCASSSSRTWKASPAS